MKFENDDTFVTVFRYIMILEDENHDTCCRYDQIILTSEDKSFLVAAFENKKKTSIDF